MYNINIFKRDFLAIGKKIIVNKNYYVKLVESFFKQADYPDKFKMAITIEQEVIKVVEYNQALRDAKLNIITSALMKNNKDY